MCPHRQNFSRFPAPKRNVRRVHRQIHDSFDDNESNIGLYTAQEKETLIRTIVQLEVHPPTDGDSNQHVMSMDIQRKGQDFDETLTVGNVSAEEATKENLLLVQGMHLIENINGGMLEPTRYNLDLKSQRKLAAGDAIDLRILGDNPNQAGTLFGVVTFLFKEA